MSAQVKPFLEDGTPNPVLWRDWDFEVRGRFSDIVKDSNISSDELIIDALVDRNRTHRTDSVVSWKGHRSLLWRGRDHDQRLTEPHRECHCYCKANQHQCESLTGIGSKYCLPLLPWERCSGTLDYVEPSEGDRWSASKGIHYPKIDLEGYEIRLFVLLPHYGEPDLPLKGCLIVAKLFLHSCYIAVRNSRGNPAMKGDLLMDGKHIKISKNLQEFLRQIRRQNTPLTFWIRELCTNKDDPGECKARFTWDFQNLVENCSCGVLEMNRLMEHLADAKLLKYHSTAREKRWNSLPEPSEQPWHLPRQLKPLQWPGYDLTQDQIAKLPPYEYVPLDLVTHEIRILTLYPAKDFNKPIVVDVAHAPLYSDLIYSALSYTWGSSELTHCIRAAGGRMNITKNLDTALRHLRARHNANWCAVWVDAVCIDQSDEREKSLHIPRMQKIYEAAYGVFIWLGGQNPIPSQTVDFLQELNSPELTVLDVSGTDDVLYPLKQTQRLADAWADLYRFFQASFFARKWIIQEIASASVPTVLLNGHSALAWRNIQVAAWAFKHHFENVCRLWRKFDVSIAKEFPELHIVDCDNPRCWNRGVDQAKKTFERVTGLTYIRQLRENAQAPSFVLLALLTQDAQCSDPRDRIFSLWSICLESNGMEIDVDYSKTIEDNYVAFTQAHARYTRRLDIICIVQWPAAANRTQSAPYLPDLELPSWCPDWRQKGYISSFLRNLILGDEHYDTSSLLDIDYPRYHADAFERNFTDASFPLPFHFENQSLIASGVILDAVKHVSRVSNDWHPVLHPPSSWLEEVEEHCHDIDGLKPSPEKLSTDLLSMIFGEPSGTLKGSWEKRDGVSIRFNDDKSEFRNFASPDMRCLASTRGRRLIVTEKGYMGLAPWHVREGFSIAILLGCSVPILLEYIDADVAERLRHTKLVAGTDDDAVCFDVSMKNTVEGWYFRGDCFVQNWMEGQMLRGYGKTTEDVWNKIGELKKLCIH